MAISRTNPHQRSLPPVVRVADEPTSAAPPSTLDQPPPTPAAAGGSARPFHRREPGLVTMLAAFAVGVSAFLVPDALQRAVAIVAVGLLVVGVALLVFLPAATAVGAATRPLYRREPWLAVMYAAFSLGLSVAVVPAALQRAVIAGAMGLLVVGVLLLFRQRPDAGSDPHSRPSDDPRA